MLAFESGELHISQVEAADLRRTYGCRLRDQTSLKVSLTSSGLAQLILAPELSGQPTSRMASSSVQLLHSSSQLIAWDSQVNPNQRHLHNANDPSGSQVDWRHHKQAARTTSRWHPEHVVLVPCAIKASPGQLTGRWFYQPPVTTNKQQRSSSSSSSSSSAPRGRLITLEQLASMHSMGLISVQDSNFKRLNGTRTASRFVVGPTYLAIERPRRALSGRYLFQLGDGGQPEATRTICDTNVIIRQPIRLTMRVRTSSSSSSSSLASFDDRPAALAQQSTQVDSDSWLSQAARLLGFAARQTHSVSRRQATGYLDEPRPARIRVKSSGSIESPPMARVGDRLQVDCLGSGYPIELVRWFRNGQAISIQRDSSDFQTEISSEYKEDGKDAAHLEPDDQERDQEANQEEDNDQQQQRLLSSLLVRQLQPRDVGLLTFECFGQNSLGERWRASRSVFVAEPSLLDWAERSCPAQMTLTNVSSGRDFQQDELAGWTGSSAPNGQLMMDSDRATTTTRSAALAAFKRENPVQTAVLVEGEQVDLFCGPHWDRQGQQRHFEWLKWSSPAGGRQQTGPADQTAARQSRPRNFNQLFSGDSRFVINGSSLQIRSLSRSHDESVYVCKSTVVPLSAAVAATEAGHDQFGAPVHQSSLAAAAVAATAASLTPAASSWSASASSSCLAEYLAGQEVADNHRPAGSSFSSISIRIVAKLKIDPFEFSRSLEEGMRAIAVCAVISGQSPVQITWFKDGQFLATNTDTDQEVSIEQANSFSSTLTFHRIRPAHSGYYTCVASNAFAAVNHTSRLLVNVAPFFIEPPRSQRVYLNSNVLVNCRAGGQPSPQIRWRKLVAASPQQGPKQVAPLNGPQTGLDAIDGAFDLAASQQTAPQVQTSNGNGNKHEFRIITSNSHIQILENGSMIIKGVDLSDGSSYSCQASNGINPSLSEMIDLHVLSPAQFDVNYETVSVKKDSMIKFNCSPRGDQPMRIQWFKEGQPLAALINSSQSVPPPAEQPHSFKYSEVVRLFATNTSGLPNTKHIQLIAGPSRPANATINLNEPVVSSELFINYADRSDTATFVCRAQNEHGKDELTYKLIVQEAPDAPFNIQVLDVDSASLRLAWTWPFDGNLALSHFVVEYRKLWNVAGSERRSGPAAAAAAALASQSSSGEWTRMVVSSGGLSGSSAPPATPLDDLQRDISLNSSSSSSSAASLGQQAVVSLKQLQPKTQYQIRVAAVNAIGQGQFSPPASVQTLEEAPTLRPSDLRVQPVSSSALKVMWRGPLETSDASSSAPIRGYYVSYRLLGGPNNSPAGHQNADEAGRSQLTWLGTTSVGATNSSAYYLTSTGGPQASPTAGSGGGQPDTRMVANYELLLQQLDKNSRYEVRVQPYNSVGVGPSSETIGQTLKFDRPGQPSLRLVATRRQSFELKWSLSQDQPVMGFSLFYKCEFDDWQEIQLALIYHYVIENLRCGNKYQIYLSAFNVVGRSEPSEVLNVRTEGTVPVAPDSKSLFYRLNISEVVLDMTSWQSGGCPITSFMAQFKRLQHDPSWVVLSTETGGSPSVDKITIPNLQPGTWYKLLLTAMNEAGSTNAEYVFGTLTSDGQQLAPLSFAEAGAGPHLQLYKSSPGGSLLSSLSQLLFAPTGDNTNGRQLVLPMSCILLLLATSLSSYLYYTKTLATNHRQDGHQQRQAELKSTLKRQPDSHNLAANQRSATSLLMMDRLSCNGGGANHQAACDSNSSTCSSSTNGAHLAVSSTPNYHHHYGPSNFSGSSPLTCQMQQQQQQQIQQHLNQEIQLASHNNSIPLDANRSLSTGEPQQTMLETLLGQATLKRMGRLATNSSSVSTRSTSCFDGPNTGSSSSSSGCSNMNNQSGSLAVNKLQLIDEIPRGFANEQYVSSNYCNTNCNLNTATDTCSPAHRPSNDGMYSTSTHVDLVSNQRQIMEANLANFFASTGQQAQDSTARNAYEPRLTVSSSFASAADLIQRQQQPPEPIYQRLDKFRSCGLANCKQFATLNPTKHQRGGHLQLQQFAYDQSGHYLASSAEVAAAAAGHELNSSTCHQQQHYLEPPPAPPAPLEAHEQEVSGVAYGPRGGGLGGPVGPSEQHHGNEPILG